MTKPLWENLVGRGENPNGVSQVTPNSVVHESGLGGNKGRFAWPTENGPRWDDRIVGYKGPQNRTGE